MLQTEGETLFCPCGSPSWREPPHYECSSSWSDRNTSHSFGPFCKLGGLDFKSFQQGSGCEARGGSGLSLGPPPLKSPCHTAVDGMFLLQTQLVFLLMLQDWIPDAPSWLCLMLSQISARFDGVFWLHSSLQADCLTCLKFNVSSWPTTHLKMHFARACVGLLSVALTVWWSSTDEGSVWNLILSVIFFRSSMQDRILPFPEKSLEESTILSSSPSWGRSDSTHKHDNTFFDSSKLIMWLRCCFGLL